MRAYRGVVDTRITTEAVDRSEVLFALVGLDDGHAVYRRAGFELPQCFACVRDRFLKAVFHQTAIYPATGTQSIARIFAEFCWFTRNLIDRVVGVAYVAARVGTTGRVNIG
jgi:hypothetical protein